MTFPDFVRGDHTGTRFPVSYAVLETGGTDELTRLFHETGVLAADNAVAGITHWREFFGGGMGRKIAIDVRYRHAVPDLPARIFAKFTREFGDPLRELFSPVMDPEVRFALLSRQKDFPVRVPQCLFADYSAEHKTGLLITERIPYGAEGIEPALDKCLDYELADPLPYYAAQTRAIATLAAHHRAGRFGDAIERGFPFDPEAPALLKVIPYTADVLEKKFAKLRQFAYAAPRLLPEPVRSSAFLDRFAADARLVLANETQLWSRLYRQQEAIALCHWNMNPDNAWFWHDREGVMRSGQLDWGGVARMNIAQSFFGMLCATETDFLEAHEQSLQALLLDEYARQGGPAIDGAAFATAVSVATALLGIAWILDAPSLIEAEIPDYATLEGRRDPRLKTCFIPRAQLQLLAVFLSEWRRKDIGSLIRSLVV